MTNITVTYDPEKWKLVPTSPTRGMIEAVEDNFSVETYESMLSAAPTPPTGKTEAEIKAEAQVIDEDVFNG